MKLHDGPCETLPPCDCVMRRTRPSLAVAMREDEAMRDRARNTPERERAEEGVAPSELTLQEFARMMRDRIEE